MKQLFNIIVKQFLTIFIGGTILYVYYKIKGQQIGYSDILNEIDPKTGLKKYTYKAFFLGVIFMIIFVLIISTLAGLNPKLYNPNS